MAPERIKSLRQALSMTQQEFASLLGVRFKSVISRLESGERLPLGPLLPLLLLLEADPQKNSRKLLSTG